MHKQSAKHQTVGRSRFSVRRHERGQILLAAMTISLMVLLVAIGVLSYATGQYRLVKRSQFVSQTEGVAEAGIEHAIRQLNLDSAYAAESDTSFGDGTFTVTISGGGSNRTIEATACIPDCTNPRSEKTIRVQARLSSENVQFFYGIQLDEGGFTIPN